LLTPAGGSVKVTLHTVKEQQNTTEHMKKTLLIAAAALAAGIISSQAQPVYSQNVVGYVNTVTPNGGTFLVTVPFTVGVSNGANEVWPLVGGQPSIPDGSQILVWSVNHYVTYFSDSGSPSLWDDSTQTPIASAPILQVGQGFFLVPAGNTTNLFLGTVAVSVGTSNVTALANGGTYLVASPVPYGGSVTNGNPLTGVGGVGLSSLNGLPDGSQLLLWNINHYDTYFSDSGSPSLWDDSTQTPIATAPSINVGQGFFLVPAGNFNWKVGL
jgi:hypothetical protein